MKNMSLRINSLMQAAEMAEETLRQANIDNAERVDNEDEGDTEVVEDGALEEFDSADELGVGDSGAVGEASSESDSESEEEDDEDEEDEEEGDENGSLASQKRRKRQRGARREGKKKAKKKKKKRKVRDEESKSRKEKKRKEKKRRKALRRKATDPSSKIGLTAILPSTSRLAALTASEVSALVDFARTGGVLSTVGHLVAEASSHMRGAAFLAAQARTSSGGRPTRLAADSDLRSKAIRSLQKVLAKDCGDDTGETLSQQIEAALYVGLVTVARRTSFGGAAVACAHHRLRRAPHLPL